ncbi:hypothetical protein RJT34_02600 [Clitoria ternatea]|uniref:CLAVATA3/ESR (CLE)-related protein 9 n=1 Tax=Clitoria ternatea TaxID=43366 RepID=A0AAN9KIA4_CLITE
MKTSLSSLTTTLFLLFLFFVPSANSRILTPPPTSSRNTLQPHYCNSFPQRRPRSLCIQLQRMHHSLHNPVTIPPPQGNDLDPRFGAEKRRVPTGPNPLHN